METSRDRGKRRLVFLLVAALLLLAVGVVGSRFFPGRPSLALTELSPLQGLSDSVCSMAFSPDNRLLATTSFDCTTRVWEVSSGRQLRKLNLGNTPGYMLAFSPDSRLLAVAFFRRMINISTDDSIAVLDIATGRVAHHFRGYYDITAIAFSPDGRTLAAAESHSMTTYMLDLATGRKARSFYTASKGWYLNLSFSKDGKTLTSSSTVNKINIENIAWDLATGRKLRHSVVNSVAYVSPDGKLAAELEYTPSTLTLWATPVANLLSYLQVTNGTWAPHGDDIRVRLLDTSTGKEIRRLKVSGFNVTRRGIYIPNPDLAFSPQHKLLALSNDNGFITHISIWDLEFGHQSRYTVPVQIYRLFFSPDGSLLAGAGEDNAIHLWKVSAPDNH